MTERIAFWNQTFIPENKVCVPIADRGFLFGDGVFTTLKVSEGKVECYSLHHQRIMQQCSALHIIPPEIDFRWIQELIAHNKASQGTWRLKILVTGGNSQALDMKTRPYGQLIMTLKPYEAKIGETVRLTIYPQAVSKPTASIKSLAYLDRLLIKEYAVAQNFDDAIVLGERGILLETAFSNLFWRVDQRIFSPDPSLPLLKGIAIQMVEKTAHAMGFLFEYTQVRLDEIPKNAQLFVCNSLKGICPVTAADKQVFSRDLKWESPFFYEYQRLVTCES